MIVVYYSLNKILGRRGIMRFRFDLNGLWHFQKDPDQIGESQEWFRRENYQYIENKFEAPVPSCWEAIDDELKDYKGVGWYFKEFTLPHEYDRKKVNLWFEGVNFKSDVYLDGKLLGSHEGGFTPFNFDLTGISTEQSHFLVVKVNNMVYYSGIHRDVYIEFYDWIYMDDLQVSTEIEWTANNKPKSAKIIIKTYFKNTMQWELKDATINHVVKHELSLIAELKREFNVQNNNSRLLTTVIQIPDEAIHLWSPDDPYLYNLILEVKNSEGVIFEFVELLVGIREWSVVGSDLFLNKQKFSMKGIITELENPEFGLSLPKAVLIKKLKTLKANGINTIRLKDHPTDSFSLEMMDRLGFCVIEEIGAIDPRDPKSQKLIQTMILRDRNHPCIFSWNLENTDDTARNFNLDLQKTWYTGFERV